MSKKGMPEGQPSRASGGTGSRGPGRLGWLRATDPESVGRLYVLTGAFFLGFGFLLIALLRWQLAFRGRPIPGLGRIFGDERAAGDLVGPVLYNQLGAMHGTIMVFLAVVPLLVGGLGALLVPAMIGSRRMCFPRLHRASFDLYLLAGGVMLGSFFLPGGPAQSGWTSYPPLADLAPMGQTAWLVGMVLLGASSVLGAVVMITTIVQARAPGLGFWRLPFFVWAQGVTSFLLLLAFPPLVSAALLQLCDRLLETRFFLVRGPLADGVGGSPVLWQHLFWFLAHPEVYVLLLPSLGIVAEIYCTHARRPLWGYRGAVRATLVLGGLSFLVWAHHMFLTGMGPELSAFFQVTTLIISIPSVVLGTSLLLTLWGGRLRFPVAMCFALAFLPLFAIGGLTGLPLGLAASDVHLHDTYYVVGHFHYVVGPGTLFAIFAALYHWWPRFTGRRLSEKLGHWHFWPTLVSMNAVFLPMLVQGLGGMHRRLWDGGAAYAHLERWVGLHLPISIAAWGLGLAQLPLLWNCWRSLRGPADSDPDPWRGTTLEWAPAGHPPTVHRRAHVYDGEGRAVPQVEPAVEPGTGPAATPGNEGAEEHGATYLRADTGLHDLQLATWLGLAAVLMLFGGLFAAHVFLAASSSGHGVAEAVGFRPPVFLLLLLGSGLGALVLEVGRHFATVDPRSPRARQGLLGAIVLGLATVALVVIELVHWRAAGFAPSDRVLGASLAVLLVMHGVFGWVVVVSMIRLWVTVGGASGSGAPLEPHPERRWLPIVLFSRLAPFLALVLAVLAHGGVGL